MKSKLRKLREAIGMSQREVAERLGVSQPHYQRWETGAAPIPEPQVKKLARILKSTSDDIQRPPTRIAPPEPVDDGPDREGDLNSSYYGEVAVHFRSGGKPLLLSITEEAYRQLHSDLQQDAHFITVQTLANQTVAFRADAVADVYLSDDAVDTFGPEHKTYDRAFVQLRMATPQDWEIVEELYYEDGAAEPEFAKFKPEDVERVRKSIMITDDEYKELVANGLIKAEDLEKERAKNQAYTELMFDLATTTTYQLSTGQRRAVPAGAPVPLYNAMWPLTDFGEEKPDGMIRLELEEGFQIAFINPNALDYVAVPTHKFEYGRDHADE